MTRQTRLALCAIAATLATGSAGCFSYSRVPVGSLAGLEDETVRLTSADGDSAELVVDHVEYPYVVDKDSQRHDLRQVRAVEREKLDGVTTAVAVGSIVATVAAICLASMHTWYANPEQRL